MRSGLSRNSQYTTTGIHRCNSMVKFDIMVPFVSTHYGHSSIRNAPTRGGNKLHSLWIKRKKSVWSVMMVLFTTIGNATGTWI